MESLPQGSDEWLQARCGIVTASVIGTMITAKTLKPAKNDTARRLTETLTAERITGRVEYVYPSRDMQRGTMLEPFARDLYAEHVSPVAEVGFMVREDDGVKVGYSPDGLVGETGLIEIKSPRARNHINTVLSDAVPSQYVAQVQCGLYVSGREYLDFISYCPGLPLFIKRVTPDQRWFDAIQEAAEKFDRDARQDTETFTHTTEGTIPTEWFDPFENEEIF